MSDLKLSEYTDAELTIINERLYERPDSYSGPDYYNTIYVMGQTRDSDILGQSNFEVASDELGPESDTVLVIRDGHWACGWVEALRVDIHDVPKTKQAIELIQSYDSYPVLDESDYSERQRESYCEYAEQYKQSVADTIVKQFGLPDECSSDPDLIALGYMLHMEAQYNGGEDSCCNFNNEYTDEYSEREWTDFQRLITDLEHSWVSENHYYSFIVAALDAS